MTEYYTAVVYRRADRKWTSFDDLTKYGKNVREMQEVDVTLKDKEIKYFKF